MQSHDSRLANGARRNNKSSSPTRDYREKITYLKFLISNAEAGIVIGKGGCTISDFQSQSETRIQLSRNYEFFPGTSDRIIMVSGPIKCVLKAVELILEKFLNETYGEEGEDEPSSKFRLVVPHSCCGGIIGKGGSTIKSFVESSQADIKISSQNDHYIGLSDRLVTVVGTISEQMLAVDLILLKLSENPSYTQSINDPLSYAGMDRRVGLVYDESMCGHYTTTDPDFLERPQRIRSIWERLGSEGVTDRCTILGANEADDKYIARVHTESHINLIKKVAKDRKRDVVAAKLDSIYFNEGSAKAAYIAAGSVIRAAEAVAEGGLDSSFAIVRPPGHHAEVDKPMGFCLFNNIAIAASVLLDTKPELGIKKILIVDWDVHHGNGTQKMFWKDPRVLYFSVHRYDDGKFYPSTIDGSHIMIGEGPGAGYTINVPWQGGGCGDADYNAVWDEILMPVARKFDPNLVMVSAGFDAAVGDPLGGCNVTPRGYGVMLKKLMELADGKIVMALEGGYNIESLEESSLACVKVLLGDTILGSFEERPLDSTHRLINVVCKNLCGFWPVFADSAPGIQFQELHGNAVWNAVLNADRSFVDEYETSSDVLNEVVSQTAKDWSEVEEVMQSHPIPGGHQHVVEIWDDLIAHFVRTAILCSRGKELVEQETERKLATKKKAVKNTLPSQPRVRGFRIRKVPIKLKDYAV